MEIFTEEEIDEILDVIIEVKYLYIVKLLLSGLKLKDVQYIIKNTKMPYQIQDGIPIILINDRQIYLDETTNDLFRLYKKTSINVTNQYIRREIQMYGLLPGIETRCETPRCRLSENQLPS